MSKKIISIASALFFALTLTACGGGGNSDQGGLVPPTSVVSDYVYDDTDISGEPAKATDTVRIHYHRNDDSNNDRSAYPGWGIWAWDKTNGGGGDYYEFDHADIYGVYVDIPLKVLNPSSIVKEVGFIVANISKQGSNYTWYGKDPDTDRSVEVTGESPKGIKQVYTITKNPKIYTNAVDPLKPYISYARVADDSTKNLIIYVAYPVDKIDINQAKLRIKVNGSEVNYKVDSITNNANSNTISIKLTLNEYLKLTDDIDVSYVFDSSWTDSVKLLITSYFDSEEFKKNYAYNGSDLGVTFDNEDAPSKTTFKVWAPTSQKVKLNLFTSSDYMTAPNPDETVDMVLGEKGVWSYTKNADLDGKYYTYTVTNSAGTNEVTDPYAKSAGLNGKRGMIVNFTKLNKEIEGWASDVRPEYGNPTDAIIYEAHVRDMTINPNSNVTASKRGTFAGLAEKNTSYTNGAGVKVSTGLAHLKELGITHVQLQPFYDYNSVDESLDNREMSKTNYNWGYDPQNYNVLEGSYSTNPRDGKVRIKEFKEMVMAMHSEGLNINMDVVYNHTGSTEGSNFQLLVPNYYYRTKASGSFYNGSGCGNEVASDRIMGRKFIVDSIKFWTNEYHMSGYRFDLMGLEDNQTMIDVFDAVRASYNKGLVYGEPWTGGTSKLGGGTDANKLSSQQTVQYSLCQDYFAGSKKFVGAFNDVIRNAVRGDNGPGKGFVQGINTNPTGFLAGLEGKFSRSNTATDVVNKIEPEQVINYVSCHDNYTLYDQLVQSMNGDLTYAYLQAELAVLTAQGIAFMQEGEDFMRSKAYINEEGRTRYEGNSYNVGDFINNMDYDLKAKNVEMFNKFKEMINLRKSLPELTLDTRAEINALISEPTGENNVVSYKINNAINGGNDLYIVHGLNGLLDIGGYDILFSTKTPSYTTGTTIFLSGNQSLVLKKSA